jgi:hypothetical protein
MSVTSLDLVERAEALVAVEAAPEIDWRLSTHLAYYAGFHAVRPHAEKFGVWLSEEGGSHNQLIKALVDCTNLKLKAMGYLLRDCRTRRVKADYKLDQPFSRDDALIQIATIKKLFAKLSEFEQEQLASATKSAS